MFHGHDRSRRDRSTLIIGKRLGMRQSAENRLHHDDGGIDDQAEIDRADRQQVGRFTPQHQDADGEEQRERDRRAHDQGTAQIAKKYPLQQHDQRNSDHHVFEHSPGRGLDQVLSIVDALDPHPRRQNR